MNEAALHTKILGILRGIRGTMKVSALRISRLGESMNYILTETFYFVPRSIHGIELVMVMDLYSKMEMKILTFKTSIRILKIHRNSLKERI